MGVVLLSLEMARLTITAAITADGSLRHFVAFFGAGSLRRSVAIIEPGSLGWHGAFLN